MTRQSIRQGMSGIQISEQSVCVRELNLHYRHWTHNKWRDHQTIPVMALHGWLDNAASFDVLLPDLLEALPLEVVALDLAGHGYSDHRQSQAGYHIWDDLVELRLVAKALGWKQWMMLGHSRGGMISTLLTVASPKHILGLVLLDGLLPVAIEADDMAKQLKKYLRDHLKKSSVTLTYTSFDKALEARCKASAMTEETAQPIVERGVFKNEQEKFEWRADRRLKFASAFKLDKAYNRACIEALSIDTLLLLAEKGFADYTNLTIDDIERYSTIQCESIKGASHHLHLEKAFVSEIVQRIQSYMQKQQLI